MEKTADAVVIGGGIFGASAAHFLAKRGFGKVVLLEKTSLAAVSTGHSAANVRTYYSNPVTVQLAWRAVQMFENDREELGGDSGFEQVGFLLLLEEEGMGPGEHILDMQRRHGVEMRDMSPEDIKDMAPQFELGRVVRGHLEVRSGYADPVRTTRSLCEKGKEWGLAVHEGVGATGIRLQGDRVTAVETEEGTIETPVVVNAAGPWGRRVGQWLGLNYSIRWSRETDMVLRLPPGFGGFPVVSDPGLRFYFRPQGSTEIVAGLGFPKEIEPLDIDNYDGTLDPQSRGRIESGLFQRIPSLRGADFLRGWASIYTVTDDWHPLVGPEPGLEGYYACFAGNGHCFKLAPPIGEALADVIAGDVPEIDIHQFRPNRFAEGEPLSSAWGGGNRA